MNSTEVARRRRASRVPEITGIRLTPVGGDATLVNISSSGVLVECASRVAPRTLLTVRFLGTFATAAAEGRVARCLVAGIGKDGAIRYHIGIAFTELIPFDADAASASSAPPPQPQPADDPEPPVEIDLEAPFIPAALESLAIRNRW